MDDRQQMIETHPEIAAPQEIGGRRRIGQSVARWATLCAMLSWVVVGVVPVVVAIYALS